MGPCKKMDWLLIESSTAWLVGSVLAESNERIKPLASHVNFASTSHIRCMHWSKQAEMLVYNPPIPPPHLLPKRYWGCSWQHVMCCSPFWRRPWQHSTRNNTDALESLLGGCLHLMCHWREGTDWKGIQIIFTTVPSWTDEAIINNSASFNYIYKFTSP